MWTPTFCCVATTSSSRSGLEGAGVPVHLLAKGRTVDPIFALIHRFIFGSADAITVNAAPVADEISRLRPDRGAHAVQVVPVARREVIESPHPLAEQPPPLDLVRANEARGPGYRATRVSRGEGSRRAPQRSCTPPILPDTLSAELNGKVAMFSSALEVLRCPRCRGQFLIEEAEREGNEIVRGALECSRCGQRAPIVDGIPRFVPTESYADNFGYEWGLFGDLQVDRLHGHSLTSDRFFLETGCGPGSLKGLRVLEAGCGGGRFSDVALAAGAELYAVDLSNAVEKNRDMHPGNEMLNLFQASLDQLPFAHGVFDLVFCFGVLQHTPSPKASFNSLVPFVKPGGCLAVDIYAAHPKQTSHWKYLVRPITKRMDHERLLGLIEQAAKVLVPLSRRVRRIPRIGKPLSRLVPIFVHDGFMGKVPPEEEVRWAVLETLDALTPAYDRPRSRRTLEKWFGAAGFQEIKTASTMNALNHGRGIKPS